MPPAPGIIGLRPPDGIAFGPRGSSAALPGSTALLNACDGMPVDVYNPAGGSTSCSAVVSGFKFGCRVRQPAFMTNTASKSAQIPHFAIMGSFPLGGMVAYYKSRDYSHAGGSCKSR